jgi:hypothetical protein
VVNFQVTPVIRFGYCHRGLAALRGPAKYPPEVLVRLPGVNSDRQVRRLAVKRPAVKMETRLRCPFHSPRYSKDPRVILQFSVLTIVRSRKIPLGLPTQNKMVRAIPDSGGSIPPCTERASASCHLMDDSLARGSLPNLNMESHLKDCLSPCQIYPRPWRRA